jgi:hypothetical protein
MLPIHLNLLLRLLWKLSTVYIIPIIILLYIEFINTYLGTFNFQQLDQGRNIHKIEILGLYLLYLLLWNRYNKPVVSYLKKLEFR